ncbi:ImmA/IrrE family metallo-endopeptidase [Paenibacillus sp. 11B]|uniref:ImmA/IrrE family metallo-endopeptidase n=1 Tax=Paenibacillus sp. 11B TaxID=3060965 RepID=UPI002651FE61|nr:ImmA/IrrE family metallo-endopeptidase [Paenibacillus sp. 11B]MDN8588776.1 ImmA/IrrE family metallo-endopeptidase [Paenibacillus sp. 11B]
MDEIIHKLVKRFKSNDPFVIAEGLNIRVKYVAFEEGTRGLYYRKLRRRFIVIDSNLSEEWKRVVCAHELAHDRLHPGLSRFWIDQHTFFNTGKFERQANAFAVKLLTCLVAPEIDESNESYLLRCGIPKQLHHI